MSRFPSGAAMDDPAINAICLTRGEHHWLFLFDDANRAATLQAAARMATNPQLTFTWQDAAELSAKIRALTP